MLRRVARVSRVGLFAIGVALLLWLPVSFWARATVTGFSPRGTFAISMRGGALTIWKAEPEFSKTTDVYSIDDYWVDTGYSRVGEYATWPSWTSNSTDRFLSIPLWLLAFLCLAWPVTSFLLARRRRGRGFEVETVGTPLSTPLPPGEVPSLRGGEGGHQDTSD